MIDLETAAKVVSVNNSRSKSIVLNASFIHKFCLHFNLNDDGAAINQLADSKRLRAAMTIDLFIIGVSCFALDDFELIAA